MKFNLNIAPLDLFSKQTIIAITQKIKKIDSNLKLKKTKIKLLMSLEGMSKKNEFITM